MEIRGTDGSDDIIGTEHDDLIKGLGDNDSLSAYGGVDTLRGGSGHDQLYSQIHVIGGNPVSHLNGDDGVDSALVERNNFSSSLNFIFDFDQGSETVLPDGTVFKDIEYLNFSSGRGDDAVTWIFSKSVADQTPLTMDHRYYGGAGTDSFVADFRNVEASVIFKSDRLGPNSATVWSGAYYQDELISRKRLLLIDEVENLTIYGGKNDDQLIYSGPFAVEFLGGRGDDIITGSNQSDTLLGEDGDDTITGNRGGDILSGGRGDDVIISHYGPSSISGGLGNDHVEIGDKSIATVAGGAGQDSLLFHRSRVDFEINLDWEVGASNSLSLEDGTSIKGFETFDYFKSGRGNDSVSFKFTSNVHSLGNYVGGKGEDHASLNLSSVNKKTIISTWSHGLDGKNYYDGVFDVATSSKDGIVRMGSFDVESVRILTGERGDNVSGFLGNDFISTGGGRDTIFGGTGADTLLAGGGNDVVYAGLNRAATLTSRFNPAGDGPDILDGGEGKDTLDLILHEDGAGSVIDLDLSFSETVTLDDGTTFSNFEIVTIHSGSGGDYLKLNVDPGDGNEFHFIGGKGRDRVKIDFRDFDTKVTWRRKEKRKKN